MRIALYQGTSFISRLIRWQTRSKYSHAAFLLDDGTVIEAWTDGVRHVSSLSQQHTAGTKVDIFGFIVPLSQGEKNALEALARNDIGTPYDYQSIIRFLTRKREGRWGKYKLFCSEQVFGRCAQIGRQLLSRTEAWRVPPDWIARSPELQIEESLVTS